MRTGLIIDHQVEIRDLLFAWLQDQGWRPLTAKNAGEALAHLMETRVDMVLLAFPLDTPPVLWEGKMIRSDADIARAIKQAQPNTKLFVMSGADVGQTFTGMGVNGFIGKPVQLDALDIIFI